jgi:membrane peptidoglycan carboxypeptidase
MGRHGSFDVRGMGKPRMFTLTRTTELSPEAAMLAGLIQRPRYLNPTNIRTGAGPTELVGCTPPLYPGAARDPQGSQRHPASSAESAILSTWYAPAEQRFSVETLAHGVSTVTTLDPRLQRIAVECCATEWRGGQNPGPTGSVQRQDAAAQTALIALDPATGAVKAIVGGRDYE